MKVLILNSDSPNNRGDRAILQGLIALIHAVEPEARITSLSQFPDRDREWFGVEFLPQSPYSTSLLDYLKLLRFAKDQDLVLWGGGELLKDYTNKLSLFYWLLKLWGLKRVNKNIVGAFQGIGPTTAEISKRLIAKTVDQCQSFLVRDAESKEKLEAFGAKTQVISSFDPAVYSNSKFEYKPDGPIGLGLRRWFHYRPSGWLPTKYRFWQISSARGPEEETYINNLARLADELIETHNADLKFFPMHMGSSEDDAGFANEVIGRMRHGTRTEVLHRDDFSPTDYLSEIAGCRMFLASRLHSAILASVANVPSICLYYVDKGRLFFEQLGLSRFSRDIAQMQSPEIVPELLQMSSDLFANRSEVREQQQTAIAQMKKSLKVDLENAIQGLR